jgi:hypothetical protein
MNAKILASTGRGLVGEDVLFHSTPRARRAVKRSTLRALRRTEAHEVAEQLADYHVSEYRFIEGPPMRRRRKAVRPVFEHVEGTTRYDVTYEEVA